MTLKEKIKLWKTYAHMSNVGEIARRKFFNNCFDGVLTCAGIVTGFFIVFMHGITNTTETLLAAGLSTAFAIGISGIWGAYLSEEAERTKKLKEISHAMGIPMEPPTESDPHADDGNVKEISRAMGVSESFLLKSKYHGKNRMHTGHSGRKKTKKPKTITEQAENFATIVASIVDGVAPFMGSILPLLPFFFGSVLTVLHFLSSLIILVCMLVFLGLYLGRIAGNSGIKYVLHLVLAGVVTLVLSLLMS